MKSPSELMDKDYCGPSKVIPLSDIRNTNGFKFIGIDKHGGKHYCIVRRGKNGFYMSSNTILFKDLIGWIPDGESNG